MKHPLFLLRRNDVASAEGEMDGEAGEVVVGVGEQTERAAVSCQNVADEQQSYALTLRFGGVERGKEVLSHFGCDATAVVGDGQLGGLSCNHDVPTFSLYALDGVLHDIDEDLLEEDGV